MTFGRPRLDDRNFAIAVDYYFRRHWRRYTADEAVHAVSSAWGVSPSVVRLVRCRAKPGGKNAHRMLGSQAEAYLDRADKSNLFDDAYVKIQNELARLSIESKGATGATRSVRAGWRWIRKKRSAR